jgi:hypothetical protein
MGKYKPIIVSFCILFLFNIHIAYAKCPIFTYKIKGVVVSYDNAPIQNAFITIFFDKEDYGDTGVSSVSGDFEIENSFATDSMSFFGYDRCEKRPSSITVVVHAENYFSKRVTFKIKELKTEDFLISLPSIPLQSRR